VLLLVVAFIFVAAVATAVVVQTAGNFGAFKQF
jgi:hypothetical protein